MSENNFKEIPVMPKEELSNRVSRIREEMSRHGVDVLILTSFSDFEYVTGHMSTDEKLHGARPVFAVLSIEKFVTVASPSDKSNLEAAEHLYDTVYYTGFQPEGTQAVVELVKNWNLGAKPVIAIDYGPELFGLGNLELITKLQNYCGADHVVSGADIIWNVRKIKSAYEAEMKRRAFAITDIGFNEGIQKGYVGITEKELQDLMKIAMLEAGGEGVDSCFVKFGKGDFIYNQMSGDRKLEDGCYIWGDFFNTYNGYPSDRCRVARCGEPTDEERKIYTRVRDTTLRICKSMHACMTGAEVYKNFETFWRESGLPPIWGAAGRIGHAGGREILEPVSIAPDSEDVLEAGMIIHIEPKLQYLNGTFQFEEIVFVQENGVEFLSGNGSEEFLYIPS